MKVYQGPSYGVATRSSSRASSGALGDVRVRQALSMAIDRQALHRPRSTRARRSCRGRCPTRARGATHATCSRPPGTTLPEPDAELAEAKALIQQAGATGKTITLGTSSELIPLNTAAQAVQSAAQAIGLKAKLSRSRPPNYINFFIDPKAREGVDGFFTINYRDYADPAALLRHARADGRLAELRRLHDPEITKAMDAARGDRRPERSARRWWRRRRR